ncbi:MULTISPECIES: STAS domain-containing protein [Leptospira]|uniref:Anti-anti-sigma factor n=4 Tax=Leptospira kirschneri TaxID=29507 RepID=A0A1T1DMA0_9LEPT|nr:MULTISPECIES: STAS domain-containing protein [Leptospira]EMO76212.1 STAS domain protein [Leptospira kirschneri str. 200801925]EJO68187.1 STAS domain protein [Leptospira kirschneri serovar Grippotyphosa str. RM52]EKO14597.1 STAS domain protein [Leptospira kirschneri str. H1]EKO51548.1 STAS domain protein [Leptospira kirschneri str. 200802841]EKO61114.1 STAS domain protein [Leptospira kirschneri str. H2]
MILNEIIISTEKIDNVQVMKLQGSINSFTEKKFREQLSVSIRSGPVILDLEEVSLISSRGIQALKEMNQLSFTSRNKLVLIHPTESARNSIKMAALNGLFLIAPDEESALKMTMKNR